jgi:hypothetical protein
MTRAAVAIVVIPTPRTPTAAAIVVIPAAIAILPAGTTVVTMESVWVATPNWVPELTGTPLRERPRLGLGHSSRS